MPKGATTSQPSFLRLPAIASRLGVHPATVREWANSGRFPKPFRFSKRTHVWDAREVAQFIEQQQEHAA